MMQFAPGFVFGVKLGVCGEWVFVFRPKWRNRQTRWSQKPLGGNPHVGSTPTFGSKSRLPSCVVVAQRTLNHQSIDEFIKSRRSGLSTKTLKFYEGYLKRSGPAIGLEITGQDITNFVDSLQYSNGGKHAYYRVLRCFYSWLYSRKSGYNLNLQDNPILLTESPKREKRILPSLTEQQVETLIDRVESLRHKCIISLLVDSGMRLSELANIQAKDIDWSTKTITVIRKGSE